MDGSDMDTSRSGTRPPKSLGSLLLELMILTLLVIVVPAFVYLDSGILFERMAEVSVTEFAQALLIALTSLLFFLGARRLPQAAAYLMSVATLTAAMLLRENDALFDRVWHGFWIWPVAALFCFGAFYALRRRGTFRQPFRDHLASREAAFLVIGFVILLFFSRIFGSGSLWREVMGADYDFRYKAALQEGIELLGYCLIAYGAVLSARAGFGQPSRKP
jgi:hypothetical protein